MFCALPAKAQKDSTRTLQEVKLYAFPLRDYAVGTKHVYLDSLTTKQATGQTLAQTLMEQTGIYLKQYGASGLASISFRGTGATHTAVSWNGMPINSFTLGEVDFNSIPLAAVSNVAILAGAGSSLYGTGSIGGSIQLYNTLPDSMPHKISAQFYQGSFNNVGGQIAYTTRKKKWGLKQVFFAQNAQNNFSFQNIARFEKPTERQQNAQNTFKGTQTDVYYLPNSRNTFATHTWIQTRQNQIAPTMGANLQTHLYTKAQESSIRLMADFKHTLPAQDGELTFKIGYLQDLYLYNLTDSTQTKTLLATFQYKQRLRHNLQFRVGSTHTFITALVDNYAETKHEARQEVTAGIQWQPFPKLLCALNLRQMWVEAQAVPFTPSLGIEYRLLKAWKLKGSAGRTYRVPTLNDRFWGVGGNPYLKPENGFTAEIGLQFAHKTKKTYLQIELTPYALWVRDWIIWNPINNVWTPQNLRSVQARGIEIQSSAYYTHQNWRISKGISYSYTKSTTENNQLPYTPFHRASLWSQVAYKQWFIYQNANLTTTRYTSLSNTDLLPSFLLWNMSVGKSFNIAHQKITLQFRFNNINNTAYQNYENRAMPLQNYMITLKVNE